MGGIRVCVFVFDGWVRKREREGVDKGGGGVCVCECVCVCRNGWDKETTRIGERKRGWMG